MKYQKHFVKICDCLGQCFAAQECTFYVNEYDVLFWLIINLSLLGVLQFTLNFCSRGAW